MSTYHDVLRAAQGLATAERLQLIESLWESLPPAEWPAPSAELVAEVQRRSAAIDRGDMPTQSWADVRAAARKQVGLDG
jgi:putative addiction module component (TIGR02574 family)